MKRIACNIFLLLSLNSLHLLAQTNPVFDAFPAGTKLLANIPFNNDTLPKHLLDIYMPAGVKGPVPLVILIHGGGWLSNDKYADIGYMRKTVADIVSNGFALASID